MADVKTIKAIPSEIMTSAGTGQTTLRGTSASLPYNTNLLKRLQSIIGNEIYDGNLFDNEGFEPGSVTIEEMQQLLTQVAIRFDNDPNYYTKRDYQYLIWYLCSQLIYCTSDTIDWGELIEKLIQDIEALHGRIDATFKDISGLGKRVDSTNERIDSVNDRLDETNDRIDSLYNKSQYTNDRIDRLISRVDSTNNRIDETLQMIDANSDAISDIKDQLKNFNPDECVLEAGSGIKIEDNIISTTTTEDIKISNVRIGRYTEDQVIEKGTDIMEILRNMLSKVIKMSPSAPSASYKVSPTRAQEYGSDINITEEITFTQGLYKAEEGSEIESIPMDCKMINISGSDWNINGNTAVREQKIQLLDTENFPKLAIIVTFSEDTVGKSNTKTDIEISPYTNTSVTAKGSYSISPYFNAYIGYMYVDSQWSDELRKEELLKVDKSDLESIGQLLENTLTINKEFKSESPKLGMILACPTTYQLSEVVDFSNIPCTPSFTKITATKSIACANDMEHSYDLYLNDATSSYVQIKSVTFKKR